VSWRLGPAVVAAEARAAQPVVRDRFYLAPMTTIQETPWITAAFAVTAALPLH
jgi:hypothetical protein